MVNGSVIGRVPNETSEGVEGGVGGGLTSDSEGVLMIEERETWVE